MAELERHLKYTTIKVHHSLTAIERVFMAGAEYLTLDVHCQRLLPFGAFETRDDRNRNCRGRTLLTTTHNVLATLLCGRIIFIYHGNRHKCIWRFFLCEPHTRKHMGKCVIVLCLVHVIEP